MVTKSRLRAAGAGVGTAEREHAAAAAKTTSAKKRITRRPVRAGGQSRPALLLRARGPFSCTRRRARNAPAGGPPDPGWKRGHFRGLQLAGLEQPLRKIQIAGCERRVRLNSRPEMIDRFRDAPCAREQL